MMTQQPEMPTKDVEIRNNRYQIGRMTPRMGSWVLMMILTTMMPEGVESFDEEIGAMKKPVQRKKMDQDDFFKIQDACLGVVKRYREMAPVGAGGGVNTKEVAEPVMTNTGKFVHKDLEYDPVAVLALTNHALIFNVAPFFEGGALDLVMSPFEDLKAVNSPRLMPTASGQ